MIRIGVYTDDPDEVLGTIRETFPEMEAERIDNPDYKYPDLDEETVEVLNLVKYTACQTIADIFNFEHPETKLSPSFWNYWIHLFLNSWGGTYQQEAEILSWNVHMALKNQREMYENGEKGSQNTVHE